MQYLAIVPLLPSWNFICSHDCKCHFYVANSKNLYFWYWLYSLAEIFYFQLPSGSFHLNVLQISANVSVQSSFKNLYCFLFRLIIIQAKIHGGIFDSSFLTFSQSKYPSCPSDSASEMHVKIYSFSFLQFHSYCSEFHLVWNNIFLIGFPAFLLSPSCSQSFTLLQSFFLIHKSHIFPAFMALRCLNYNKKFKFLHMISTITLQDSDVLATPGYLLFP